MGYTIEHLLENYFLVRFGENHEKFGDPYTSTVIMIRQDNRIYFKGAVGLPPNIKDLFATLKSWGYKAVVWERYRPDGTIKYINLKI